jgi:hypothetical protein
MWQVFERDRVPSGERWKPGLALDLALDRGETTGGDGVSSRGSVTREISKRQCPCTRVSEHVAAGSETRSTLIHDF